MNKANRTVATAFPMWWEKLLENDAELENSRDLAEQAFMEGWNQAQAVPVHVGARYRLRSGEKVNGDDFRLEEVDWSENRFRLVPIVQTMPIFWESTQAVFNDQFELYP